MRSSVSFFLEAAQFSMLKLMLSILSDIQLLAATFMTSGAVGCPFSAENVTPSSGGYELRMLPYIFYVIGKKQGELMILIYIIKRSQHLTYYGYSDPNAQGVYAGPDRKSSMWYAP
jgi:hypothetical protein